MNINNYGIIYVYDKDLGFSNNNSKCRPCIILSVDYNEGKAIVAHTTTKKKIFQEQLRLESLGSWLTVDQDIVSIDINEAIKGSIKNQTYTMLSAKDENTVSKYKEYFLRRYYDEQRVIKESYDDTKFFEKVEMTLSEMFTGFPGLQE